MDKKAFTLVEIIVVITILAILGLISFISLQGFTIDARDTKRTSDVKNLITKITIENSKGIDYSQIITNPEKTILKINGVENKEGYQSIEDSINWEILRENKDNFKDPTNGNPYPFAYTEGNANGVGYSFIQLAYVEEKTGVTRLVGNYYEMEPGDSPSLFKGCIGEGNENEIVKDGSCPIYDIGVTYEPPVYANCEEVLNFNGLGYDLEFTIHKSPATSINTNFVHGTKEATFRCWDGSFSIESERIECDTGYNSNGIECTQSVPTSCPLGQYIDGTNCTPCPDGGTTKTTTATSVTQCIKTFTCATKPADTDWNSVSSYTQTRNGSSYTPAGTTTEYSITSSETACRYKCSDGFHTENSGQSCISNTRTNQACENLPNTIAYVWHTATITQTRSGSKWTPSLTGTYSANAVSGECKYKCATNYVHNGTNCVSNSRTQACSALGTGEVRSSGDTGTKNITQTTTDGTNRTPITTKSYSTNTSASYCYFKCNSLYTLDTSTNTCKSTSGVSYSGNDIIITNGSTTYTIANKNAGATIPYDPTNSSHVFSSSTRNSTINAWAGGLYEWGNNADISYASTTSSLRNAGSAGASSYSSSLFYVNSNLSSPRDWSSPQNDNLWGNTTNTNTARKGPCPDNYHVPTTDEWRGLIATWFATKGQTCAVSSSSAYSCAWIGEANLDNFMSDLLLPRAGFRDRLNVDVSNQGSFGLYWSSSPSSTLGFRMGFYDSYVDPAYNAIRAYGFSVRCFKN